MKNNNPAVMDKDLVLRLCEKSLMVFSSKWKWRKICAKTGADPETLEFEMDQLIEIHKKNLERTVLLNKMQEEKNAQRVDGSNNEGNSNGPSEATSGQEV
jgi:hypothetical protein